MRDLLKALGVPLIAVVVVDYAKGRCGDLHPPGLLLNLAVAAIAVGFMGVREMILRANRRAILERVNERLQNVAPGTDPMTVLLHGNRHGVDEPPHTVAPETDPFATLALRAAWLHLGLGLKSEKLVSALRHHMTAIGEANVSDADLQLVARRLPAILYEFRSAEPHGKKEISGLVITVFFGSGMVVFLYLVGRLLLDMLGAAFSH